jgi:acyl-CoA synthetase (AMP-forming)/AMP-acid ligase II
MPLVTGNSIIIYEGVSRELSIAHILNDDRVGILKLTPSHMKIIREQQVRTTSIRCMIVGGEELETTLAADISASFNDEVEIYNEYGPTEATVGCMIYRYDRYTDVRRSVPVGVPIWNTQIYILQEDLQPAPFGVAGELCISGAGLAREYLNRPELNTSRLTGNPFLRGQRIYRTGDLARFLPDGNIELLGRIDNQVKFNGHRMELGEIEAALSTCPGISNSAVRLLPILQKAADDETIFYCQRCGSPSNYPDISFNARGICNTCESFESYKDKANGYFKSMDDLRALFDNHKTVNQGSYDCLMLLSGGKDSTYVLYQLVRELGLKVLVFSLDNNYISEGAKANMRRVTEDLGVELIFGTTPAMNAIFVDSLKEFSNVCNGCFKTIYTMSLILARQKGIRYIVTGLSRGQLFETRLNDLFCANIFNPTEVDKLVLQSRIAYHKKADVVSENLDSEIFRDETLFEQVEFVDFYRYCDVKLEDMYAYLDRHAPWVRPSDTGRSTNCLINDAGIYIHKKERGYHNYALPYSWDVRMGHKKRDAALHELNDELDMEKIRKILKEIGYDENYRQARGEKQLVAYYAAAEELPVALLRAHLSSRLPAYMMPAVFIRLENMPLTINGKIDYAGLPHPGAAGRQQDMPYIAPRTQTEIQLAGIWKEVLGRDRIGVKDNLFEMGGHSLLMTLLYSRIIRSFGRTISMAELFEYATIEALGQRLDSGREDRSEEEDGSGERARLREERREDVQRKRKLRQEFRTSEEHL